MTNNVIRRYVDRILLCDQFCFLCVVVVVEQVCHLAGMGDIHLFTGL